MDYLEGHLTQGKSLNNLKNKLDILEITKVDKVKGKQLTQENFTKRYKDYIDSIINNR